VPDSRHVDMRSDSRCLVLTSDPRSHILAIDSHD
jgi:hypothetical protein